MNERATPGEVRSSEGLGLVERLRQGTYYGQHALMNEAADEIELLRAEVAVLRMACGRWEDALKRSDQARRQAVEAERDALKPPRLKTGGWWAVTGARLIVQSTHPAGMTTHRELNDAERAEWTEWMRRVNALRA